MAENLGRGAGYIGFLYPPRMQTDGNLVRGSRRETIKSQIRTAMMTRRYVNRNLGGDRLMRPGMGAIFQGQLIQRFDESVLLAVIRSEVTAVLRTFEDEGLIRSEEVHVSSPQDGTAKVAIGYTILAENFRDDYTFEVATESPRDQAP